MAVARLVDPGDRRSRPHRELHRIERLRDPDRPVGREGGTATTAAIAAGRAGRRARRAPRQGGGRASRNLVTARTVGRLIPPRHRHAGRFQARAPQARHAAAPPPAGSTIDSPSAPTRGNAWSRWNGRPSRSTTRSQHRHKDGSWGEMAEAPRAPRRGGARQGALWGIRRLFRCTSCDEERDAAPAGARVPAPHPRRLAAQPQYAATTSYRTGRPHRSASRPTRSSTPWNRSRKRSSGSSRSGAKP